MKAKRNNERGAIFLFLIVVIAILSLYIHRLLPKGTTHTPRLKKKTIAEMNEISWNLREYYFDNKVFPTLNPFLTQSAFVGKFFNLGNYPDTTNYKGDFNYDQWGTNSLYKEENAGDVAPEYRKFWSVGPDFTNDTAADDDIVRQQYATVSATARTRRLLAVIRAACTFYAVTLSSGTWSGSTNRRGNAFLGPEFDTDGWGTAFVVNTVTSQVYSYGPDNANGGGDDITW